MKIWEVKKKEVRLLKAFNPHAPSSTIHCITWNATSRLTAASVSETIPDQVVATGASDGKIALSHHNGTALGELRDTKLPELDLYTLSFSPSSHYLASGVHLTSHELQKISLG